MLIAFAETFTTEFFGAEGFAVNGSHDGADLIAEGVGAVVHYRLVVISI